MNLDIYVFNDPINGFDWFGLADCSYVTSRAIPS
jgi:hypothetical protein